MRSLNMKNASFLYRFHTGMVIALALTLVSFEWKTFNVLEISGRKLPVVMQSIDEDIIPITIQRPEKPKPIPNKNTDQIKIVIDPTPIINEPEPEPIKMEEPIVVPDFYEPEPIEYIPQYTAELEPEFPGGINELYKYVGDNVKYSERCREARVEGKVFVKFTVDKTGAIVDPIILRGIKECPELEKEVLRVISNMPHWIPGKQNGRTVSVYRTLPVVFSLK